MPASVGRSCCFRRCDIKKPRKLICSKKDEQGGLRGPGHQRDWEGLLHVDGPEFEVKLLFMLLVPVR